MSADAFEKTNFGWQMQQMQQQFWEWLELKWSQFNPKLPNVSLPPWFSDFWLPPWLFKAAFWLILGLLLSWIGWQVWRVWGDSLSSFPWQLQNSAKGTPTTKVSELKASAWLRRSQEFYRQGNYGEACRSLYMAMLQRLNDTGMAPHQPSRTDGEYRQLTQQLPHEGAYQTLLTTHEQLCFDNAEMSPDDFERCQQAYQQIQGQEATPLNPGNKRREARG